MFFTLVGQFTLNWLLASNEDSPTSRGMARNSWYILHAAQYVALRYELLLHYPAFQVESWVFQRVMHPSIRVTIDPCLRRCSPPRFYEANDILF